MQRRPPELMEELVEEVLLRFPPDDPASLARAALVCKLWCRLVSNTTFRRRFREFHGSAAPLLGVIYTGDCKLRHDDDTTRDTDPSLRPVRVMPWPTSYFVPTTSFRPVHAANGRRYDWRAMDAHHGRVLLHGSNPWRIRTLNLSVWDPITDEQRDLPMLLVDDWCSYSAAVACAATAGGNCDHLDCHRQPFLVVVVGTQPQMMQLFVYSSEAGAWSHLANLDRPRPSRIDFFQPSVLVGSALHFLIHSNSIIVKYNMTTSKVSTICLPFKFHYTPFRSIVLMTNDDGGLGFVAKTEYHLELWSMVVGGGASFVLRRVIDLQKVLPSCALIKESPQVSGFADCGASRVLFITTSDGLYSLEINSGLVKKVADCCHYDRVVIPYVSFCTPTSRV